MIATVSRLLFVGLVLLLLAACGSSGPGQLTNLVIPNVKTAVTGDGVLFGVAFAIADQTAFTSTSVAVLSPPNQEGVFSTQSLIEADDGLYVGMVSSVDSSGNTTLSLPHADDIPSSAMVPAADSFWLLSRTPDCSVVVEPASVQMTLNTSAYPGFAGLLMTSAGPVWAPTMASDQALDLDNPPDEFITYLWIFSDGDAVVSFGGLDCAPFSASDVDFHEGWNLVGWRSDQIARTLELINVEEPETLYLNVTEPGPVATPVSSAE